MYGKKIWIIAEGYIPEKGPRTENPALQSHETACILNAGEKDAEITVTIYFSDREPAGPFRARVPARRTLHLRFDQLTDPEPVPRGKDYSSVIESSQPVVVQHTRLDGRLGQIALLSTMAYGEEGPAEFPGR